MMTAVPLTYAASPLTEGNLQSPVRVIIFEDLQCSDCAAFDIMLEKQILPVYGTRVAFEHRDFPLPKHNWARKAAIASRFFESIRPELALQYRRATLAHQTEISPDNFGENLAVFAKAQGLEIAKVRAAMQDPSLAAAVENAFRDAVARGVGKTPTVLVDGEPFIESFTYQDIAAGLDRALRNSTAVPRQ